MRENYYFFNNYFYLIHLLFLFIKLNYLIHRNYQKYIIYLITINVS